MAPQRSALRASRDRDAQGRAHVEPDNAQWSRDAGTHPARSGRQHESGERTDERASRRVHHRLDSAHVSGVVTDTTCRPAVPLVRSRDERTRSSAGEPGKDDVRETRSAIASNDLHIGEVAAGWAVASRGDDQRVDRSVKGTELLTEMASDATIQGSRD